MRIAEGSYMVKFKKQFKVVEAHRDSEDEWRFTDLPGEPATFDTELEAENFISSFMNGEIAWVNFEDNYLTILTFYESKYYEDL